MCGIGYIERICCYCCCFLPSSRRNNLRYSFTHIAHIFMCVAVCFTFVRSRLCVVYICARSLYYFCCLFYVFFSSLRIRFFCLFVLAYTHTLCVAFFQSQCLHLLLYVHWPPFIVSMCVQFSFHFIFFHFFSRICEPNAVNLCFFSSLNKLRQVSVTVA